MTKLTYLSLSSNLFSGTFPHELGNLVNLEKLILSANYLTGELPVSLTNLTKLSELRISSNNFTGRMPDFFRSWRQLTILEIQASGFEGPIPSSISILSNLTVVRISDLVGEGSKFPNLSSMTVLKRLMFRSCNISGPIPTYISNMTELQILDLSFNRLDGKVPDFGDLKQLKYLILCECLSTPCSKDQYSLHIYCGGKATTVGNIQYEDNEDRAGPAKFFHERENWGFSSTGSFWDYNTLENGYIATNESILTMDESELYTNARQSPLSFTYYAHCLASGTYKVKLHFAEIVFRGNRSFYSLGRRIFDIYVQEKLVWEDFDIENSAQGVDKAVVVEHTANVINKILMIRFCWAGKGTRVIPNMGIYGPLISAISVESDFILPDYEDNKMKISIVVGAIVLVLLLIFMILGILWWKGYLGGRISREMELKGLDLQTGFFTYRQIKAATNNFNAANKMGEGGSANGRLKLDWPTRQKICVGIARGLVFLHEESTLKIVHRDIKTTNVLLDQDLNSKISDFGLAKLDEEENTHISTRIAGAISYMAPEYALWGYLTYKVDVYSFGIVAFWNLLLGRTT
ncbi:hypothetical protein ACB098_05G111400 [Castanea mollissima]